MAVVLAQSFGGSALVEFLGLENEAQVVEGRRGGQFEHLAQGELTVALLVGGLGAAGRFVEQHLAIAHQAYEACVLAAYHGLGVPAFGLAVHPHIEFVGGVLLERDINTFFGYVVASALHGGGIDILEHFELVVGLAGDGAERDGDGQSYHVGARYAHAHGVFQDIGTQRHFYFFGQRAEHFGGFSHTERHTGRFGASHGGHHLFVEQFEHGFPLSFGQHKVCV